MRKYLYNHTSEDTAYVVEDYPWGFRLRTTIRYWIETNAKHGDRFCSQTINPKSGKWCAAKKSTYSPVMVMYLNDNDHVRFDAISNYSKDESIHEFVECHKEYLNEGQKSHLKNMIASNNIMKHVKFECINTTFETAEEKQARKLESNSTWAKISMAIELEKKKVAI
jgi:hypothetical protein